MDKGGNRPKCINCQSGWVYTREDGMRICRTCGHREQLKILPNKNKFNSNYKKRR
jgi:hypothetical protein